MADNRLSTFLPDDKAAFGVFPQMKPRRRLQDPAGAANVPLDVTRGRVAGLAGLLPDVLNFMGRSPMPTEQFGETQYEPAQQLPYGSEYFLQNLPLKPTSRIGEVAGQAGAFVPLNPMPVARAAAAGVKALGPTAGRMAESYLQRTGGILPLDVYHGTPHTLPPTTRNPLGEFDASKIGTGEGAQVYGHGIYTAEAPAVARAYQNTLSKYGELRFADGTVKNVQDLPYGSPEQIAGQIWINKPNLADAKFALSNLDSKYLGASKEDVLKQLESLDVGKAKLSGNLYKVDLPDEKIAKMLDWDKPLSQQSPEVQAALKGIEAKFPEIPDFNLRKWMDTDPLASTFHNVLNRDLGVDPAIIASTLKERGIPGVKYLDQQSRNAGGWHLTSPDNTVRGKWMLKSSDYNSNGVFFDSKKEAEAALKEKLGKETRNFVTFPGEEKNLTILERNGQPSQNSLNSFIK